MYKRITTLFLIFISVSLFSQEATFKAGEFIILLQKNSSFETFVQQYSGNGRDVIIDEYKRLSASEPIYLIKVISTTGKEKQELSFIKNLSAVALAQLNHIVSMRDIGTDDPRYKDQWQWKNTGQDGGIQGADISAETAWETTTTGGKTANGDTIVVCIVDDGTNYEHEDLAANIWFNSKEIPGNNIDDDGNGFIDDVHGWNFQNNDSNVNEGGHGVNVNGMIGAVGNNGIGVSGINWNVKMMNVVYAGTEESSVIESYDYPLQSRIFIQ
jgi:serine protease